MSRFIASIVALLLTSLSDAKAWPDQPVKMGCLSQLAVRPM